MEWFSVRRGLLYLIKQIIGRIFYRQRIVSPKASFFNALNRNLKEVFLLLVEGRYLTHVIEKTLSGGMPPMHSIRLSANLNLEETAGLFVETVSFAHGLDEDLDTAFSRAAGEFIERYPFLIYKTEDLLKSSVRDLRASNRAYVNPIDICAIQNAKVDQDTNFFWEEAINACTGARTFIPAQFVYWNYDIEHEEWSEPLLRERNTCGLASGPTKSIALRNALYELIQRDGFFLFWHNRVSPPRVLIDRKPEDKKFASLLDSCEHSGLHTAFANITSDIGVPSFVCVLRSPQGQRECLSVGMGSDFSIERALFSALTEAISIYTWTRDVQDAGGVSEHFDVIKKQKVWEFQFGQRERGLLWSRSDMFEHLSFLTEGKEQKMSELASESKTSRSFGEELAELLKTLSLKGPAYEPVYIESKHPLPRHAGSVAVRVFVPGFIPMYMEESGMVGNAERSKAALKELGHEALTEPYTYPHPFL